MTLARIVTRSLHLDNYTICATFVKTSVRKMNERLLQFLAAENISQSQFADTLGITRASVSHVLAGRNRPSYDFLSSLMIHYPSLNVEWLMHGKGKMYKRDQYAPESPQTQESPAKNEENQAPAEEATLFSDVATEAVPKAEERPEKAPESIKPLAESPLSAQSLSGGHGKVTKVIVFFSDNTFQEFS